MKNILVKLGNVVATLLMFGPLYIIVNYDNIKNPIFWLICLVLYDIYMYDVISTLDKSKSTKN